EVGAVDHVAADEQLEVREADLAGHRDAVAAQRIGWITVAVAVAGWIAIAIAIAIAVAARIAVPVTISVSGRIAVAVAARIAITVAGWIAVAVAARIAVAVTSRRIAGLVVAWLRRFLEAGAGEQHQRRYGQQGRCSPKHGPDHRCDGTRIRAATSARAPWPRG